jgi:propionate CoA-transferase
MADSLRAGDTGKVVSAREAVRLIHDSDTVATGGFVGIGFAENIAVALEELFLEGESEDADGLGHPLQPDPGLRGRTGRRQGAWAQPPRSRWPGQPRHRRSLGTRSQAAATGGSESHSGLQPAAGGDHPPLPRYCRGKPGTITRVGLGTFVDPRFGGGKLNAMTTDDIVR